MLQVMDLMEQLNKDAAYELEQINMQITYLEGCLQERSKKLEMSASELGGGMGSKQEADELMNELEHTKRDQDNRWS